MIALYKFSNRLEEKFKDVICHLGETPAYFYSKNALLDQVMIPMVIITPSSFVNELASLSVPVVPLSISISDIRSELHKNIPQPNKIFFITAEHDIPVLTFENSMDPCEGLEIVSKKCLPVHALNKDDVLLAPIWDKHSVATPQIARFIHYIEPTHSSIVNAVRQACSLIPFTRDMVREKYQVEAIVKSSHEGVIAVDRQGYITIANENAKSILGLPEIEVGSKITNYIPQSDMLRVLETGKAELGDIAKIQNRQIVINRYPVLINHKVVGAVSNFKELTHIQKMEMKLRKKLYNKGLGAKYRLQDIVGNSKEIVESLQQALLYAQTDASVLITGESGTGKELFAQGIHLESSRASGPFVAVNCAAFPESLLESELFGYEEGSFTGANKGGKQGLFELAHGGTLFLDEIGEMPLRIQALLLRVLQEKCIRRIGGERIIPVDVRIIAATNKHLENAISTNEFRADLYYRINVLTLELPSLRRRLEDIPALVRNMINQFNHEQQRNIEYIEEDLLDLLKEYQWPGNIRELRNVIERMVLLAKGKSLCMKDATFFSQKLTSAYQSNAARATNIKQNEKALIMDTLKKTPNKTLAARELGIDRSTLWRKLKEYNL
ncbi:sigma-54 interaction domain-containing protein [Bacillus sp. T33-2]|uniref:sigma-54 interaction domain-containing protein n=1 Tax=Bacillus sp. T33-2 TaxID=2054168 RepID=UPI00215515D5|nr:sigma 54-interacting transcriptional regulator [Bacillus sp. T33-2]